MVKVIANYLPQFHETPENNRWWGEGYTDWIAVKNAKRIYKDQTQPKVPLCGYYDLSDAESIRWQAELAREYGIYGFGIYHYWFSSYQNLLTKPVEVLIENKNIEINFMLIWDNGSWKKTWSNIPFSNDWAPLYEQRDKCGEDESVLAELIYGDEEDWRKHFEYLLPLFRDERYIKINDRPVFVIFHQDNKPGILRRMIKYWDDCAKGSGFAGICVIGQTNLQKISFTELEFNYQPPHSGWNKLTFEDRVFRKIFGRTLHKKFDYDKVWEKIIDDTKQDKDTICGGAFVGYDDTPRRGRYGKFVKGGTPDKFGKYMKELLSVCKDREFVFLTAWNEWGEGAYLEPDQESGYEYLEALKKAIESVKDA